TNMNVFVTSTIRFTTVQVSNVNGGVRIESLNSKIVKLTTVNGRVSVDCVYCLNMTAASTNGNIAATFAALVPEGSYNLTAPNANLNFTAPSSASFRLSASDLNGSIQILGLSGIVTTTHASFNQTLGTDGANVQSKYVNAQITITGT